MASQKCLSRMLVCGVLLLSFTYHASADDEGVGKRLKSLVAKSGLNASQLGLVVLSVSDDKKVFGHNDSQTFVPASLTKILTATSALELFPLGHQFETTLEATGAVKDGILDGSLYLRGGGDPTFTSERLWFLANEFVRNDIKEIKGDLVVDDSLFDQERFDEDRDPTRVDRAYDAPVGAMSFNWNSVNVYIRPGTKVGGPAIVKIDPVNSYITLVNEAKTQKSGAKGELNVSRLQSATGDTIRVSGHIGVNNPEVVFYKSISRPELWTASNTLEFLRQRGVTVTGTIRSGVVPAGARVLAKSPGAPIGEVVEDMMKFSNNFVAEMITKNLSALAGQKPATMKGGLEQIRVFLDKVGLKRDQYQLQSPSGLSFDTKMKPIDFAHVLAFVQRDFRAFPEFLNALPIAGVDGTLKHRFQKNKNEGSIRAKTGLMKSGGAVGLAGFVSQPNGKIYVFVFIFNSGHETNPDKIWHFFDDLTLSLVRE